jgi:iron complex transport system substrate-binding protein
MHGSSERQIEQIRALGVPLFHSEPAKLDDIPSNLVRLGKLVGTEAAANAAAADLRAKLAALTRNYAGKPTVRLFHQVWDKPLYTLSGAHIVSDAMRICGGENIFGEVKVTAPVVSVESVLQRDPEVILDTAERNTNGGLELWKPYPMLTATRRANLFRLDGDLLNRAGPRMIAGTAVLCEKLELARAKRK